MAGKGNELKLLCGWAFLLVISLSIVGQTASVPDLSGKWRINPERSEDAKTKLEAALQSPLSSERRGAASEDARDVEREQIRRRIEALIEASESLDIKQDKNQMTITEGNLRERKLYTDGRPFQRTDRNGNLTTIRARWRGERLVVDTGLADGGRFTETYELASGTRQLLVTVTSVDRRLKRPLVIHRVYDEFQQPAE